MKAIVLCAGYGTRLGDLTREIPKPMLRLGERPLVEYTVRHLVRQGFDSIAMNLSFMPDVIPAYFGDGARWGARLCYFQEVELLGTAGGVKNMADFVGDDAVLVHYGDVLTNQDFSPMLQFHEQHRAIATLLVHQRARSNSAIDVDPEGRIVRFLERPTEEQRRTVSSPWVFSGVAICTAELIGAIPPSPPCDLPRDVFTSLVETGRLFAFPLSGDRCAVDSPERLDEARAAAIQGVF
jgi:NDP-sugar pyrophosphorylase family protein